ncbi:MAG: MaoC family dehydratase [Pseudorhodoplanes sp.]|jgi:acyl dehydratase|nr:MaoC family dehydratase [Pseudorhodoplanes sp.]
MLRFYEDLSIGDRAEIGTHRFTADEIKAFARAYDPQPFHVDEEAAKHSHFGALCASGWHTASTWMRLMVQHRRREAEVLAERGEPIPKLGPSPGFRELRWFKPVYASDVISYATEVVEKRASISRPEWGLVSFLNSGTNQHGEMVLSFTSTAFVGRRMRAKSAAAT